MSLCNIPQNLWLAEKRRLDSLLKIFQEKAEKSTDEKELFGNMHTICRIANSQGELIHKQFQDLEILARETEKTYDVSNLREKLSPTEQKKLQMDALLSIGLTKEMAEKELNGEVGYGDDQPPKKGILSTIGVE